MTLTLTLERKSQVLVRSNSRNKTDSALTQSHFLAFMSQLLNKPYDAFADEGADEDTQLDAKAVKKQPDSIHIRIQQRNGRKTITTISGIPTDFDLKKLAKAMKKDFACNASIEEHEVHGQVLQMQGDQRQKSMDFFLKEGIATKETVKMHGF